MQESSQTIVWQPPPADLALDDAEVHVWLIEAADHLSDEVLSPAEISRAGKFHFERDRRLFVAAHVAVRKILARYLNAPAAAIQFISGVNGKPALANHEVEFNLSHSHQAALFAVSWRRAVGIDIESVKADFTFDEVAERFFTPREVSALRALPRALQRQAFYKCWTSKEAFLKAKGTGLSGKLDEVEISQDNGGAVRVRAVVAGWSLREVDPSDGYEGAVVTEGPPARMSLYRWEG
ncbi:MAG TPA: 4'-phosphopantetheinyl transferase superfamily protein [Terriglobales bacterium]|nr:4'-phosphopantetheinyl transferase superfamily protein [Terriglobales bacterium]